MDNTKWKYFFSQNRSIYGVARNMDMNTVIIRSVLLNWLYMLKMCQYETKNWRNWGQVIKDLPEYIYYMYIGPTVLTLLILYIWVLPKVNAVNFPYVTFYNSRTSNTISKVYWKQSPCRKALMTDYKRIRSLISF